MTEERAMPVTDSRRTAVETPVYAVPDDKRISVGAPSLAALPNGALLAAFDQSGPDVKGLPGKKGHDAKRNRWMQGRVMRSADGGATWKLSATYPFRDASLFRDGGDVYLLGEASGGLCLMRSPDGGGSWSAPLDLTGDQELRCSPTAVVAQDEWWHVPCLAPSGGDWGLMVWRAPRGASLMNRKAWTAGPVSPPLANGLPERSGACGVPWPGSRPSWRHPVAIPEVDARHPWHGGGRLQIAAPAGAGREHWAVRVRVDRDWGVAPQEIEGGEPWLWTPWPGGHGKFDLFVDESAGRYWLAGSRGQSRLALGREAGSEAGLNAIGLWTSANLADWFFVADLARGGEGPPGVRCDPSLAVAGGDLVAVCRAGGPQSRRARETTRVVCSRLEQFRTLSGAG
ncbi:MAG TPA: sialidase family protein [Kiritimatiellia bacterium]|nr:sialidase family protein [Kiritimatiellia bacterium]